MERSLEIGLASKRKLRFVTGTIIKDPIDLVKQEAWDTCNNMVISWLLNNVSESIKKSIMFPDDTLTIWMSKDFLLQMDLESINSARKSLTPNKMENLSLNTIFK